LRLIVLIINNVKTRVYFENNSFKNILSSTKSFITTTEESILEMKNSSFIGWSSGNGAFGIITSRSRSQVTITDAQFMNNSAFIASIFEIESKSVVVWNRWEITNNYAMYFGVFQVISDGKFEFYDSQIYSNYAVQNSIGTILGSIESSFLNNTEIYSNEVLNGKELIQELKNCNRLWFLNDMLKSSLKIMSLDDFESAPQSIQLILGALSINSSTVRDQIDFLNSFTSTVDIYNTTLWDIIEDKPIMEVIDSDIVLTDFNIK